MKKIILLFSLMLIITSCSSNDEDTYGIFNPPNWIQGTWKEETSGAILTFTSRDIKYTTTGDSFSFSKQTTKFSNTLPQEISSSPNLYVSDFSQGKEGSIIRFNFVKTSDTKMESKGHLPGNYIKQ
ncbi:membrane lipoprotein lipid attachment site-containing protein [Flavobacterium sp. PL02]|jgi:hypothetical protein|uniref:membrane lipoprotein lipid attachment site-containing protein n=1 Tax=Flavobacterium sp. PL02 TaxID=3088354 RepID=UPI002B22D3C9|nr:membrane lipoprotein lipid attachment site-containing protein [Flavobacterium sp. PL02]MEA9415479.1 membrane lipoprotein lipid attachment site-containing protein [Flavobacterium sp. PL02]